MKKCIYYKDTEENLTFNSREHIFPAGLGGIMKLEYGMVSDKANNRFSLFELDFIRRSMISTTRSIFGPGKRGSLSESKASQSEVHVTFNSETDEYPSLGYMELGKPHQISQLVFTNSNQVHIIFDPKNGDFLKQFEKLIRDIECNFNKRRIVNGKYFEEIKFILGSHKGKIYFYGDETLEEQSLLELVNKVKNNQSIDQSKTRRKSQQITMDMRKEFNIEYYARMYSKIAFNFLAHVKGSEYVLNSRFDPIREYILYGGDNRFATFTSTKQEKKSKRWGLPEKSHFVSIQKANSILFAYVSLYDGMHEMIITLCDDIDNSFKQSWPVGLICDWEHRKEYTLLEFISNFETV